MTSVMMGCPGRRFLACAAGLKSQESQLFFCAAGNSDGTSCRAKRHIFTEKRRKIMLTSLALIFLVGLSAAAICGYLHLPRIIGMLFTGIILGPHVLGLLDDKILSISSELRQITLIIILLKAGLSLNLADLKKVGRPAVMMAFVPASFEICGYLLCAPMILGITRIESAVMGAVLAAVSPAVVVPRMFFNTE
jgi:NhaP-type Na+/H+ or K+/H+ antiporter